jgi:SAM-dependent methyltransferase
MSWTYGYSAETEYVTQFYPEVMPEKLAYIAKEQGCATDVGADFRLCELGSANGFTLNALAALSPQAELVGIDFMPSHIAKSQADARTLGLENVTFYDWSFEEALVEADFQPFDVILLHGVLTWVSAERRAEVMAFIRRFLKPGGLVYASFNCLPGWADMAPLRHLLKAGFDAAPGEAYDRIDEALSLLQNLRDEQGKNFAVNARQLSQLEVMVKKPLNYVAHEYLNADWNLFYIDQLMAEFYEQAKCDWLGSTDTQQNHLDLILSMGQERLVAGQAKPALRELTKDYCLNQAFRADVWVKGFRALEAAEQSAALANQVFALTRPFSQLEWRVEFPSGTRQIDAGLKPFCEALMQAPSSLHAQGMAPSERLLQGVSQLVASGQLQPVVEALNSRVCAGVQRFNRWVDARMAQGLKTPKVWLSPWGFGLPLAQIESARKAEDAEAWLKSVEMK